MIPSYIRVIFDEDTTQNSLFASKVALREKSANGPVLEKGDSEMLKAIFKKKGDGVSSLKIEKIKSLSLSFNNKVKGFNKLYAFLNYPSNTPNQIVQLSFKIKDIKNFNFGNCKALSSDFEKKAKNSNGVIPVDFHSIFNRGERAKGCPRCTSHKTVVKNIFNYLVGYFYPFYIDLIVNSNFGTLYNSKNPENVEKNFSDLIEFKHSSTNKHFRFECLEGASEVKFRSKFVKNIDDEKSEEIIGSAKIDLVGFIYEAKTNKEFIYTEQKGCGQNCE